MQISQERDSSSDTSDDNIQCNKISSSSDLYYRPFKSKFTIGVRQSYRRPFNRFHDPSLSITMHNPRNILRTDREDPISTRTATITASVIFSLSLLTLVLFYNTFPNVTKEESEFLKIPWNIEEAKQLGIVLNKYKSDNYYQVIAGIFLTYIFLQAFAIPGSLSLSILSGFLFPFFTALLLICTCSMIGSFFCFFLSQLLGRKLMLRYFPEKVQTWSRQVEKHRSNMFNYIVFLRIMPFLPNWFINLTAPVVGVPLCPFVFGTFIGVAPSSFIAIQAGQTLNEMTANDGTFSFNSIIWLTIFSVVSLLPIFVKRANKSTIITN